MHEQIEKWAREARMCINFEWVSGVRTLTGFDATPATLTLFAALVAQHERERAAKVVETFPHWLGDQGRRDIAAAIRNSDGG